MPIFGDWSIFRVRAEFENKDSMSNVCLKKKKKIGGGGHLNLWSHIVIILIVSIEWILIIIVLVFLFLEYIITVSRQAYLLNFKL